MVLKDNPQYQLVISHDGHNLYIPNQEIKYHASRFLALQEQQIYASNGIEKDRLVGYLKHMIELCNSDKPVHTFRTDIGTLCNNLLYRTQYPIDNKIALRTGAILTFLEDEDPNTVDVFWINKKLELCDKYPELYTFFLTMGLNNLTAYTNHSNILTDSDYFLKREQAIAGYSIQYNPK